MTVTCTDLASDLAVDEGDVTVLLELLGADDPRRYEVDEVPNDTAAFVRRLLDPHRERTAPAELYWPGTASRARKAYGLGGPDPTRPDGEH